MRTVWLLTYSWVWNMKKRIQIPQQYETLSLDCTALGFIIKIKNEEFNSE